MKNTPERAIVPKNNMEVEIGFPQCVQIELVQINELRHYEIFTWLTSLFSTSAAGFWVAFATTPQSDVLFWVSLILSAFTFIFGWTAHYYRQKLKGGKIKKVITIKDLS